MFRNLAVALDRTPESARALEAGLDLARQLNSKISTVTIKEPLAAFLTFAVFADGAMIRTLQEDHDRSYQELIDGAVKKGRDLGLEVTPTLLDGDRVEAIGQFVSHQQIDLLIIGLHRSSPRTHSLWSTVYSLAQELSCSMLGVH